jgi:hypothetical protein
MWEVDWLEILIALVTVSGGYKLTIIIVGPILPPTPPKTECHPYLKIGLGADKVEKK